MRGCGERQVQSRHLCSAQALQTVFSCLATSFLALCKRTEALFEDICSDSAKFSTGISLRSTYPIADRYLGLRVAIPSPMHSQMTALISGSYVSGISAANAA
jgi:hypothetical protein